MVWLEKLCKESCSAAVVKKTHHWWWRWIHNQMGSTLRDVLKAFQVLMRYSFGPRSSNVTSGLSSVLTPSGLDDVASFSLVVCSDWNGDRLLSTTILLCSVEEENVGRDDWKGSGPSLKKKADTAKPKVWRNYWKKCPKTSEGHLNPDRAYTPFLPNSSEE